MTKDTSIKALIALLLLIFGACAGYRAQRYYESLAQKWKDKVIAEAIAEGDIIRTSEIRLKGLSKSTRYALDR